MSTRHQSWHQAVLGACLTTTQEKGKKGKTRSTDIIILCFLCDLSFSAATMHGTA